MKYRKTKNKTYTYFFVPSLNCREDGRDLPHGRNAHANSCWRDKPLPVTPNPLNPTPSHPHPLPSNWLVGVVKYKSSGRSLKSCWHRGRGPGCLSFSLVFYQPWGFCLTTAPLISPSRGFVKRGRALMTGRRGPRPSWVAGRGCRGFQTGRP